MPEGTTAAPTADAQVRLPEEFIIGEQTDEQPDSLASEPAEPEPTPATSPETDVSESDPWAKAFGLPPDDPRITKYRDKYSGRGPEALLDAYEEIERMSGARAGEMGFLRQEMDQLRQQVLYRPEPQAPASPQGPSPERVSELTAYYHQIGNPDPAMTAKQVAQYEFRQEQAIEQKLRPLQEQVYAMTARAQEQELQSRVADIQKLYPSFDPQIANGRVNNPEIEALRASRSDVDLYGLATLWALRNGIQPSGAPASPQAQLPPPNARLQAVLRHGQPPVVPAPAAPANGRVKTTAGDETAWTNGKDAILRVYRQRMPGKSDAEIKAQWVKDLYRKRS